MINSERKRKQKRANMFRYLAKLLSKVTDGLEEQPNDRQEWEHSQDERQINGTKKGNNITN